MIKILRVTKPAMVREHMPLIRILKSGSKQERLQEAKKQSEELKEIKNK